MNILVTLPKDRARYGRICVETDGETLLGPFPCLGKGGRSKGAKSSDWRVRGNDTPTGEYHGETARWEPANVYGPNPVIRLDPVDGNALEAEKLGRSGLAIHGGRDQATLWSTEGCVRVFDRDMAQIIALLNRHGLTNIEVTVKEED
jgi:hypothetical protein